MSGWAIVGGLVAFVLLVVIPIALYNRMVRLRNRCTESWSNVDTELKRRYELIPNLVRTVEGYAKHERALLQELVRARAEAAAPHKDAAEQATAEGPLVRSLSRVLAVAEDYPELKASRNFLELQRELAYTEDRIQASRRFYNANVRDYRNLTRSFPGVLVARPFGFGPIAFFEVAPVETKAPTFTLARGDGDR